MHSKGKYKSITEPIFWLFDHDKETLKSYNCILSRPVLCKCAREVDYIVQGDDVGESNNAVCARKL